MGPFRKKNCRVWGEENPHMNLEQEQLSPSITVWRLFERDTRSFLLRRKRSPRASDWYSLLEPFTGQSYPLPESAQLALFRRVAPARWSFCPHYEACPHLPQRNISEKSYFTWGLYCLAAAVPRPDLAGLFPLGLPQREGVQSACALS